MVISSRWFLLNRPELQEAIGNRLDDLGIAGFEVVNDFQTKKTLLARSRPTVGLSS